MRYEVQLPGAASQNIVIETGLFRVRQVSVGGLPAQQSQERGRPYLIPLAGGGVGRLRLRFSGAASRFGFTGSWELGPTIQEIRIGRKLNALEVLLILLPLALVFVFGVIGGVAGFVIGAVNGLLIRSGLPAAVRYAGAVALPLVAAGLLYYVIVGFQAGVFVTPGWEKVGACWESAPQGAQVSDVKTVDCATPHAAEVYAVPVVDAADIGGSYSADKVSQWSDRACQAAYEPYIGVAYEKSVYDVYLVYPSETTWSVGDRLIACVALDPNGAQLVGSLKGVAR